VGALVRQQFNGLVGRCVARYQGGDNDARIENGFYLAAGLVAAVVVHRVFNIKLGFIESDCQLRTTRSSMSSQLSSQKMAPTPDGERGQPLHR